MIEVVYEDDDLIAVCKPEGVGCQPADPDHPDDLPYRLKRERGLPYLGIHQRLDPELSGVVVYAKDKRANKGLAAQVEGRTVRERYVAIVEGWRGGPRRLEHWLARGRDGRTVQSHRKDRKAKRVVTEVEAVEPAGDRARLRLRVDGVRAHPLRAQLAAVGAPVVGDALYGGAAAPRLMLQLGGLALDHPVTGARLVLEAREPAVFEASRTGALDPFGEPWLRDSLERAIERRWGLSHRSDLDAYRLVHEAGDALSGVAVDAYGDWLVVHLHDDGLPHERAIVDALAELATPTGVYVKRHVRQANVLVEAGEDHAPTHPVWGEPAPSPLGIGEHGLPLLVRLDDGLGTGVFLDQRLNRQRVRELSGGARVLNLFAHTAAFTVAAGIGGARESLSVDSSKRLLERAREQLDHAGLDPTRHRLEAADCFDALDRLAEAGERFELVIVDPPTYSTTKSTRWTSGKAWRDLGARCLRVTTPGGHVLACSNDRRMSFGAFRRHLHRAADDEGTSFAQLKDLPMPPEYRGEEHTKSLLGRRA